MACVAFWLPCLVAVRTLTFGLIGIFLSVLSSAQDRLSPSLSLDEAVALGLAHNRAIANAAMEVDKASHDIATARSRRLPVFSIESQASQLLRPIDITFPRGAFGTIEGIGPIPSADAVVTTPARLAFVMNAQATQPLSQLHKLNLNIKLT
jgi:hypothetical protein